MPTMITFDVDTGGDGRLDAPLPQLHGLACRVFEGPDNPAAHHAQRKLFAVGPLTFPPGQRVEWRTSWLSDDVVPPVLGRVVDARLGAAAVRLTPAAVRHRSFGALRRIAATRASVAFISPTSFSRSGVDWLLPDPHLLLGGLARRWNALASDEHHLDLDVISELARATVISSLELCTIRTERYRGAVVRRWSPFAGTVNHRAAASPGGRPGRSGFVGTVTFRLNDSRWRELFGALFSFAGFAGVGRATTHGCGAVVTELAASDAAPASLRLTVPAAARPGAPGGRPSAPPVAQPTVPVPEPEPMEVPAV